jgi:hypothetical protein
MLFRSLTLRWEDTIKLNLKDIKSVVMDWMYQDQSMVRCEHDNELSNSANDGGFLD